MGSNTQDGHDAAPESGPGADGVPGGPVWERMEDQLAWYGAAASRAKRWFQSLKVIQIVVAAAIPVLAAVSLPVAVAGAMGALIVVLEGVQQLFQFQQNWTTYRATSEALKHEKFLFLAGAGAYARHRRPNILLAERVERLVSREQAGWSANQREGAGAAPPEGRVPAGT